jgi:hypothetical protein
MPKKPKKPAKPSESGSKHGTFPPPDREAELEEGLEESFPASDPPSVTRREEDDPPPKPSR